MHNEKEYKQLLSIKSEDNSCLIEFAMNLHYKDHKEDMIFLSHHEASFVKNSMVTIKENMENFSTIYSKIRFMFLKDSWVVLDKMYGKTFFINEIQKMMKEEEFSTLYFHRADTFFEGCSQRDIERLVSDIVEVARYYHKKVIFSLSEQTRLGQIMSDVLYSEVDYEYSIQRDHKRTCQSRMLKCKKEDTNIVLFSDQSEIVKFHNYLFKRDNHIIFNHIVKLDETNQSLLEEADIIIFNLHNIPLKDKLLNLIKKRNLKTKFLFLSDDKVIRKRDKIRKIEKGISQVFEKNFDLLEYVYTIERIIGRDFYTTVLNRVNIAPHNRYFTNQDAFKNSVYNYLNYHIYFSMIAIEYSALNLVSQEIIENCIRDLDIVYHNEETNNLIFLLIDILPQRGVVLIEQRLNDRGIKPISTQAFDVDACLNMMGMNSSTHINKVT